ncbi:DNA endonuclease SmrA [Oceanicoccus sagamiensis]|uniref:DNA endonuclease SmrA n=1 Tax=Oceanicoccus sagamiensis TaxID=716816 RepID=A0A1X9N764_9GAMM|nr:DNA endonuclease SmrA [Oceanicoccus sagamiensis]ARN72984.1 DNA endonuclease SmrA [Oceanicoccus sagamiensis]
MSDDHKDDDLFLQEMGDVKPIKVEKKVSLQRSSDSALAQEARRKAATQELSKDKNHLVSDFVDLLDPFYPLEFKRSGVQHGVFKKLKQGKYPQEGRIDLHRMTVEKARQEVYNFIKEAAAYDLRSLVIVHGKGSHSKNDEALLKSYVNKWLPDMDEVQAFCSAQPQHGGLGAAYVLLSKSEKKKQENRDRLSRGRTVAG